MGLNVVDIDVFYSAFANVFFKFLSRFFTFFLNIFWNVFTAFFDQGLYCSAGRWRWVWVLTSSVQLVLGERRTSIVQWRASCRRLSQYATSTARRRSIRWLLRRRQDTVLPTGGSIWSRVTRGRRHPTRSRYRRVSCMLCCRIKGDARRAIELANFICQ